MTLPTWVNGTAPAIDGDNLNAVTQAAGTALSLATAASALAGTIGGVVVTGTPTTGQVPVATGPGAAHWANQSGGGGSGLSFRTVQVSANYTALSGDYVEVDATSANITVTIPVAASSVVAVVKVDGSAHKVSVVCAGSVDGDPSGDLVSQWAGGLFIGNGVNVRIMSANFPTSSTGGGGGTGVVDSVTAADTTVVVGGTTADPTLRVGNITESQVTNLATDLAAKLVKASNLSDLASASTARTNLGLGAAAVAAIGTGAGTVAAGNDTRFTQINGVTVSGTPTSGQVPTATSGSAATWQTPTGGGGGGGTAAATTFNPTGTGWTSTNLQALGVEADAARASDQAATVVAARSGMVLSTAFFPPSTTGSRPTAASVGVGGTYYDTTLHKPGWSDGTNWRDAAGTTI